MSRLSSCRRQAWAAWLSWDGLHRGNCRNPRDPTRISGGSSAGPACSPRAGLALGGLGTDASGSLRVPASLCGLVAVRPTHGLVPTAGVVPLAWFYDTVGPLARTVGDAALLLEVIAGPALAPPGYACGDPPDLRGRTVGLLTQLVEAGCDPEIAGATRAPRVAWRRGTRGRAAAARAPRRDPHHHPVRRGGGRPPPVDRRPAATLRASGA